MTENRYIVVEGVIGVGKTSLAKLLADRLKAQLVLEEVEENPFLAQFYDDKTLLKSLSGADVFANPSPAILVRPEPQSQSAARADADVAEFHTRGVALSDGDAVRRGFEFLTPLQTIFTEHPGLRLTTFSDCVERCAVMPYSLPRLVAGSWVYGTLSTWIGDKDKNRGWDMLGDAKQAFDRAVASGRLTPTRVEAAELQLATCEGSDWFWWFGDYNPGAAVSDFERLFRRQLAHLYELLGEPAPDYLQQVFAFGTGDPSRGGVMRQSQ